MKYYILAIFSLCSIISCKKSNNSGVITPVVIRDTIVNTDTVRDTVTVVGRDTVVSFGNALLGNWHNSTSTLSFSKYAYVKDGASSETYLATSDSIYHYYLDKSAGAWYGYTLSKNFDTLTLYPVLLSPLSPYIYYRD